MQRIFAEARSWIARSRSSLAAARQGGDEQRRDARPAARRLLDGPGAVRPLLGTPEVSEHLGPPDAWPRALVTALAICLDSPAPMWLVWGRDAVLLYNDAVDELLPQAHRKAFGVPAFASKTELWEISEPSVEAVRSNGRPRRLVDQLFLKNNDGIEERYFDVAFSPVLADGEVAGVLCAATETTRRVRAERRAATLADLAGKTAAAADEQAAWAAAVAALERNPADLPYAVLYAAEGDVATLAGTVGLPRDSARAPARLDPLAEDSPWPLADVRRANEPARTQEALVCPLVAPGGAWCGYLVAGLNPRQPLDDDYRAFVTGAAERLAEGVGLARSRDEQAGREASLERWRRQLEQQCSELMRLYDHAPIPILVVRGDNYIVERVNEAAATASDGRELLGKPLFEAVPELTGQGFDQRLRNVVETGVPDVGREVVVRLERNGRLEDAYFTFVSSPLMYGVDADARVIIVANDVTEQVRSRAALEASEARYRNIFEGVDVSIWVVDVSGTLPMLDGLASGVDDLHGYFERHPEFLRRALDYVRVVDVNGGTLRMFGARNKDEVGRSLRDLFVAETWQAFGDLLIAAQENRPVKRTDAVACTLAGERRELMMTIAPIVEGDRPGRVLLTMTDITERKRMEQALRETDRQKDEFLATLAHELRNPLAPLRTSVDLLRTVPGQTPDAVLDIIERQVEYLVRLAHDLFESSRIRRGAYDFRKEHLPLGEVLRDGMETSRSVIQASGHELDVRVPDEPLWIDGDRMRLSQIFANLLNNAARYTREPGRIVLQAERTNGYVEVRVSDSGVGIAPEAIPKLFTMFSRLGGAQESEAAGLGIGLALAKQLVEMHGGEIEAESEGLGKGSTFVVRLPLGADMPQAPQAAAAPAPSSIEGRRLLIVEDDADTAESLKLILEANGAEVRVAMSGPKAIATFASFEPDGVLLDIGLPGMDGYEVARRLRAEFPSRSVQIVALTGWGREEDIVRARSTGFDDHLVKPVDIAALRRLLSRPLDPPPEKDESPTPMRPTG